MGGLKGGEGEARGGGKSRPGHPVSSAWCLWIVHECDFRIQAKNAFQYLCP